MSHRQDGDDIAAILGRGNQDHGAGTILDTFFLPAQVFTAPKIAVADNQTLNGLWKRHTLPFQLMVESRSFVRRP